MKSVLSRSHPDSCTKKDLEGLRKSGDRWHPNHEVSVLSAICRRGKTHLLDRYSADSNAIAH